MNKKYFLLMCLVSLYLLSGCVTEKYVERPPRVPRPSWVTTVPREDASYHYFVGVKTHALTYESGWKDAFQDALSKIALMIQSEITVDYDKLRHEKGIAHDTGVQDAGSYIKDQIRVLSSEIARGVKEEASHSEDLMVNNAYRYNVYVLVRYPRDEYERIKKKILGIDPELEAGVEFLNSGNCEEAKKYYAALIRKQQKNVDAHFYLAQAYDDCGNKLEALKTYKGFLEIQTEGTVLAKKAKVRIDELKEEIIGDLLNEAEKHAGTHDYEDCLKCLEKAHTLVPENGGNNGIPDKYFKYANQWVAYEFSLKGNLLKEKTVTVANFGVMNEGCTERGLSRAATQEFCNALANTRGLTVVERISIDNKHLLEMLEIGETGLFSPETKKELGRLIQADTLAVGCVGYVGNTLNIFTRLVDVEEGRIIASKSVPLLGWEITETPKDAEFRIDVTTDRKTYAIGDRAFVIVRPNKDCYVTLLNLRSNGEIYQLLPNKYKRDNLMRANAENYVPSWSDSYDVTISEPRGRERVMAIATTQPIRMDDIERIVSTDTNALVSADRRTMRGVDADFRTMSVEEMRGLHVLLETRGMSVSGKGAGGKTDSGADNAGYVSYPKDNSKFDYAVSFWEFETR